MRTVQSLIVIAAIVALCNPTEAQPCGDPFAPGNRCSIIGDRIIVHRPPADSHRSIQIHPLHEEFAERVRQEFSRREIGEIVVTTEPLVLIKLLPSHLQTSLRPEVIEYYLRDIVLEDENPKRWDGLKWRIETIEEAIEDRQRRIGLLEKEIRELEAMKAKPS